jgi:DNA-binding response OmpR family regulator
MKRILVVEDDVFIGLDLVQQLGEAGFEVVGLAASVAEALEIVSDSGCDAAVLDVNLGRETSEVVAVELARQGVPFLGASGYDREQHPQVFHGAPLLTKPFQIDALVAELRRLSGSEP